MNKSAKALQIMVLVTSVLLFSLTVQAKPNAQPVKPVLRATLTHFDRIGVVRLFAPPVSIKSVAILASGDGRWDDPLMMRMAQLLVAAGVAVIGIDTPAYLKEMDNADRCAYMAGDFEDLAHAMEKQLAVQRYLPPVLIGYSSGASLIYAVLGQAPRGMFQAGMSVGFCAELDFRDALCSARGALSKPVKGDADTTSLLLPLHQLSAHWVVLQGGEDHICGTEAARHFTAQVVGAELYDLPNVDHFFSDPKGWRDEFLNAYQTLLPVVVGKRLAPSVSDLPVTEIPSTRSGDELAVLFTGDGGWAELDQELAHDLSTAGVSVVALSSLQYFWKSRSPDQAAQDLSRLMAHYSQVWQRPRIHLLGYSFGADVLPAIINALPAADRVRITSVGLLSLLPRTSFEIRVAGWLGQVVGEQPVRPELEQLAVARIPVTCIYGRDDDQSLCRELPPTLARVVALPGGHNCDDDHAAIVRAWLSAPLAPAQPVATIQNGVLVSPGRSGL
jgi:type IV secretory pathway VirJ component